MCEQKPALKYSNPQLALSPPQPHESAEYFAYLMKAAQLEWVFVSSPGSGSLQIVCRVETRGHWTGDQVGINPG